MRRRTSRTWRLRLYVAGQTPRSLAALANLRRLCEDHLAGRYRIEIIDLLAQPKLARRDEIVVIPTLIRRLPPPLRKIVGDLSNDERVLVSLDAPRGGGERPGAGERTGGATGARRHAQ